VDDLLEWIAGRALEVRALRVRHRNQRGLHHVLVRNPEDLRHLLLERWDELPALRMIRLSADAIRARAEAYARLGYVAFVPDIYGEGKELPPPIATAVEMKKYMDNRPLLRARAQAGLDILSAQAGVDPEKVLAAGYCFGGAVVLELARSGAKLAGVVTFHGSLSNPTPADAQNTKGRVLVLHGADDPAVPPKEVLDFEREMRDASVAVQARNDAKQKNLDWQLVAYGNTVHSFTDPAAGNDNSRGSAYNETSDKRSWSAMQAFFKEIMQ